MKKNHIALLVLLLLSAAIIFSIFRPVLENPNSYLFSKGGDAVKSYYNFSYYLKYDEGIRHDGINYPYGDHLQYINSHPLYVNALKFIDNHIIPIDHYGTGILNLTMIISIFLLFPVLYLILRIFALPYWYSVMMALILGLLTPQFDRILGHFEMSYAFFIPLFWYFLLRWKDSHRKTGWVIALILLALVGGFTSAYYAAFFSIFALAYLLVEIWNYRKKLAGFRREAIMLLLVAVLPLIIVRGLVGFTDWVHDRPDNPWGFFIFHSNVFSIFLPFISPLKSLLGDTISMNFRWEGRAFVGSPATLLALSIVIGLVYHIVLKKKYDIRLFFPNTKLNPFLVAASLILLFSMCFPFKYGFKFLLDLIPPLKQFRALGRFSWIFYYVFTVYAAYFFYVLFRRFRLKKMQLFSFLLIFFTIGYWAIDSGLNIQRSTRNFLNENDILESKGQNYQHMLADAGIMPNEYQAILFLPYANTCGDKLLFHKGMNAFNHAMKCSYHTGLPLIQSFSPRLSFTHALSSIQMLADSAIRKTRIDDMNDKPILLLTTEEILSDPEQRLYRNAEFLHKQDEVSFSKVPLHLFHDSYKSWKYHVEQRIPEMLCEDNICTDIPHDQILYQSYDDMEDVPYTFKGNGAVYTRKGRIDLLSKDDFLMMEGQKVNVSFWMYVDTRVDNMPDVFLLHLNKDGSVKEKERINTREVHNIYDHWVRIEMTEHIQEDEDYQLYAEGYYVSIDELIMKPVDSDVYIKSENEYGLFNNYPLHE